MHDAYDREESDEGEERAWRETPWCMHTVLFEKVNAL